MKTKITEDILEKSGFELMKAETDLITKYQESYNISNYKSYRLWTNDKHPLKIDIDNGWNNRIDAEWSIHIDNDACETIGYADVCSVEEFNIFMKVFDSKFKLKIE